MQKKLMVGVLGLLLFLVAIVVILIAGQSLVAQLGGRGAFETRIAHFEQSPKAFVKQVQQSSGAYDENAGPPVFDNQIVPVLPPRVEPDTTSQVLGTDTVSNGAEKWIDIDLSDQRLTTWEGDKKLKEYPVSTGLAGSPTVKGEFRVWRKVLSQGYRGGSKERGTYYYLPNVPYSLFFHKGYAIHAAYWHNDFGIRPRSHGCVNVGVDDAKEIYEWANPVMPEGVRAFNADETNPGTRIVIHD